jgi:predicted ester cyclase
MFRTGFPDWKETVEDVIDEGDKVVIRVTGRGTHEGEFQGIAPTGNQAEPVS